MGEVSKSALYQGGARKTLPFWPKDGGRRVLGIIKGTALRSIIRNVGIIFLGNSTASALNLISFTLLASHLGPKMLAVFVLAQTYALIFNDIFNVQTWESLVKFGPEGTNGKKTADVIVLNVAIDIVSGLTACIIAVSSVGLVARLFGWEESSQIYLAAYSLTALFNITSLTIGVPRLFDQFFAVAKIGFCVALVRLLAIVATINFTNTLGAYIGIFLICDILNNIATVCFSLMLLRAKLGSGWWKNPIVFDRRQLRFIWWTNLRTILRIPVRHFDMLVISSVMSLEKVGIYKVYKEIANIINRIGDPVNQAIYPEFTKMLSCGKTQATAEITRRTTILLSCIGAALTLTLLIASKQIVSRFFGEAYLADINVLYCLLILLGINFSIVPINSLFIAAGFVRYSFLIVLMTNMIYLACVFGLGSLFGMYGVVMAFAVQMALNQGAKGYFLWKHSGEWGLLNK